MEIKTRKRRKSSFHSCDSCGTREHEIHHTWRMLIPLQNNQQYYEVNLEDGRYGSNFGNVYGIIGNGTNLRQCTDCITKTFELWIDELQNKLSEIERR